MNDANNIPMIAADTFSRNERTFHIAFSEPSKLFVRLTERV